MRHRTTTRSLAAVAFLLTTTFAATASPAGATETHCYAAVVDQLPSGEYVLSDPECFEDMTAVYQAAADAVSAKAGSTKQASAIAALSIQSTLATHYDGASFTGSSFTVSGVNCAGGYVNMTATWDNRVSSTSSSFCPRIRHWTNTNASGSSQDTTPSGNLTSPVNNAVSSIQYLT